MQKQYKPEGYIINTVRNRELISSLSGLEYAMQHGIILEGLAYLCDENLNTHVSLGKFDGVISPDDMIYNANNEKSKDIAILTRVGKAVCFKVKGFSEYGGKTTVILSRLEAQKDCMTNYLFNLNHGDIIPAVVTHIENFGAFADIGCGIISMLPIDCISVSRISHPKERLCDGMKIYCVIKEIDKTLGRIFITHKELLGTWEENAGLFSLGQTVPGIVRSIESYGIFVELTPNLAGLAEVNKDNLDIQPGQTATVYIKSIIPERMKIKLVLIDSQYIKKKVTQPEYMIDVENISHIDVWNYSPESSGKIIRTVFG